MAVIVGSLALMLLLIGGMADCSMNWSTSTIPIFSSLNFFTSYLSAKEALVMYTSSHWSYILRTFLMVTVICRDHRLETISV